MILKCSATRLPTAISQYAMELSCSVYFSSVSHLFWNMQNNMNRLVTKCILIPSAVYIFIYISIRRMYSVVSLLSVKFTRSSLVTLWGPNRVQFISNSQFTMHPTLFPWYYRVISTTYGFLASFKFERLIFV